jgi:hypothetical protein
MKISCILAGIIVAMVAFCAEALLSELSKVDNPNEPLPSRIGLAETLLSEYPNGVSVGTNLPVRAATFVLTLDSETL